MALATAAFETRRQRLRIAVTGAVQGVGFRPYTYRLACQLGLAGSVRNTPVGVEIDAQGEPAALHQLLAGLRAAPAPARVDQVQAQPCRADDRTTFVVAESSLGAGDALPLPDLALCADCLAEIRDPASRRFDYAFTSCSRCGPRYSIIAGLPYDRARTGMAGFTLCPACTVEYADPTDRRFQHQANACPACGPRLWLADGDGQSLAQSTAALAGAAALLRGGGVLALKGLGGFQLLVDARDRAAVARLRERKARPDKPFAVMYPELEAVQLACHVSAVARAALTSAAAPIVLLPRRADGLASNVAPGNPRLGVMLPYTPLHRLLLDRLDFPVVATSGNVAGEPLCSENAHALARLAGVADAFLLHDRPIQRALDDSVVQIVRGVPQVLRAARGYTPLSVACGPGDGAVLAFGGHLKAALAVGGDRRIVLGQHLGDLDSAAALAGFDAAVQELPTLTGTAPTLVVCDAHPDYASSLRAGALGLPLRRVQHHHAHVVAVMAEHDLDGEVLGVAWDGSGLGDDGTLWGGEFFACTRQAYQRRAWLWPFPLPGGERAAREPRRAALGLLHAAYGEAAGALDLPPLRAFTADERRSLHRAIGRGINAPLTSSIGRLFDAVAALLDLCQQMSFEGQAAQALQSAAEAAGPAAPYPLPLRTALDGHVADWGPLLAALLSDVAAGTPAGVISMRFHAGLANLIVAVTRQFGAGRVVLAGGCFQNALLLDLTAGRLADAGVAVFWPQRLPPGDGGLAVGQAAVAGSGETA